MLLFSGLGAIAAARALADEGTYEPTVIGLTPQIYLKFFGNSLADSSGNGRAGTLSGSGALGVAALAPNVGAGNTALDLGGAAWVEIPHAAADTELNFPTSSPWSGGRKIADCTVSLYFQLNTLPNGSDKAVVVSKASSQAPGSAASYDGSWEAYVDSNGAVHVECRSFRGRPCRIRTPDGAVAADDAHHLVVQLAYDGVTAWLDGAKFEDGYGNLMHVFGLAADILGQVLQNNFPWRLGRSGWGGQANLIVDEFAVYLKTLSRAEAEGLAQRTGPVDPLEHFIWGQRYVNASGFANINAAIDNVSSLGGGTVLINPGTYNEGVTGKSNVRLKRNGAGTVTINGQFNTPVPSIAVLTDSNDDVLEGDRVFTINNSRAPGDVLFIRGAAGDPSPLRHDRRWNTAAESNDPSFPDSEVFEIESRTATTITFVGAGAYYDFADDDREDVRAWTPSSHVAIEDVAFSGSASGSNAQVNLKYVSHCRLVNVTATTSVDGRALNFGEGAIYCQARSCTAHCLEVTNGIGDRSGLSAIFAAKDIVYKDCFGNAAKHSFTTGSAPFYGPVTRIEAHNHTGGDRAINRGNFDFHGAASGCIAWNLSLDMGLTVSGWRLDLRWAVCGTGGTLGDLILNDGQGDGYLRNSFHTQPRSWFGTEEGVCGTDRCHFEDIQHSASPTGTGNQVHGLNYGTGPDSNTFIDVDTPPPPG